jgi:hypothetical protein
MIIEAEELHNPHANGIADYLRTLVSPHHAGVTTPGNRHVMLTDRRGSAITQNIYVQETLPITEASLAPTVHGPCHGEADIFALRRVCAQQRFRRARFVDGHVT